MARDDDANARRVTIGVLLAGGEGRRLGRSKLALEVGGATLLNRNLALLREVFPRVAVSLREGQEIGGDVAAGDVAPDLLTDRWTGSPLAGIATALEHYQTPVFVLACDLAFAERRAITEVVEGFEEADVDVALPIVDDMLEPLHAVYDPACLTPMRRLLERGGHRIVDVFPDVRVQTVPFPSDRPFFNINRPEDLARAQELAAATPTPGNPAAADASATDSFVASRAGSSRRVTAAPTQQPALVAVVGKSDSGKTTLIEALIPELRRLGLRVGAVKHDVHGFEIDTPGKDSWRHGRSGADGYVIAGPDRLAFVGRLDDELPLGDIARRFFTGFDLVVAEGYKRTAPHRVEIFRVAAGHAEPLCGPGETLALVTDAPLKHPHRFAVDDVAGLTGFLTARLDELRRY